MKYLGKISNKTNYKFITSIPLFENSHVIKSKTPFSFYYFQNFWNSKSEIDKIFQHNVVWFWYEFWKSESESLATHSAVVCVLPFLWPVELLWNHLLSSTNKKSVHLFLATLEMVIIILLECFSKHDNSLHFEPENQDI